MLVNPIQQNNSPNFHSIKSIKCNGLYKKYPYKAKNLLDAFSKNQVAMSFCKEHDVDIVLAATHESAGILSSLKMIFVDPTKSKILGIFGSNKSSVMVYGTSRESEEIFETEEEILERATQNVITDIKGDGSFMTSLSTQIGELSLNSHKELENTISDIIRKTKNLLES